MLYNSILIGFLIKWSGHNLDNPESDFLSRIGGTRLPDMIKMKIMIHKHVWPISKENNNLYMHLYTVVFHFYHYLGKKNSIIKKNSVKLVTKE